MKKLTYPLVIGNWKMHPQSASAAKNLFGDIKKGLSRISDVSVVVAPPTIFLPEVYKAHSGNKKIMLGAQNVHWDKLGAYTGEISLGMLAGFDVSHVIIGHSERRAAGESDEMINKKVIAALKANVITVLCIGEAVRDTQGNYFRTLETQIRTALASVSKTKLGSLVVAYEPIWAIGTGKAATPADAYEMKLFIQKVLTDLYGRNAAMKVRILYGGSVNAKNAAELMREGMVDGFLVGGASLRASEFVGIVNAVRSHE